MIIRKTLLNGNSVDENHLPVLNYRPVVTLPGIIKGNCSYIGLSEEMLHMHMLLMGGTGSGKTNTFYHILPQLQKRMTSDDVMLVFDSKLDFDPFHRESDYVLTYRKKCKGIRGTWNLFMDVVADGWDKKKISLNADEIAETIFAKEIKNSPNQFFPIAAKEIMSAVIKGMTYIGMKDKDYRVKYMNNEAFKKYLSILNAEKLSSFIAAFPELSGVQKYVGNGKSEQALGVFATLQSIVSSIFASDFGEDGRFSVRKCVKQRNGKTLYIEYNPSRGVSLQPIYQLLVDLFLKESLSPFGEKNGNVFILCDELKMIPSLNHFEDAVNFGRSLNVSVIAGIQSMEQLYEVYGEYRGKNIASAFQTVFCFHTNDMASRQYIKDIFGENMSVLQYITPSGKTIEEKYHGNTVEDWNITSLDRGEAIIGLPYKNPFLFRFSKYVG